MRTKHNLGIAGIGVLSLFLPSQPANDSPQTAHELAELHRIQETRSPAQTAHAQKDNPQFEKELDAAKAETRAALGLQ